MGFLRLFLASVVAIDHYRAFVLNPSGMAFNGYIPFGMNAGHAVLCFYVVSGFLISYALSRKYSGRDGILDFYRARFIRIYPLYWGLVALFVIVNFVGARTAILNLVVDGKVLDLFLGVVLIGSDWRVSFGNFPLQDFSPFLPMLKIAWTLGAELTFYLLAPIFIRSKTLAATVLLASLATRFTVVYFYGYHNVLSYTFFPSTVMFFLLGHFARLFYERYSSQLGHALLAAGLLAAGFKTWGALGAFDGPWFYAFLVCFLVFVPYLFDKTKDSKVLNYLGDVTYPLYLTHASVIYALYLKKDGGPGQSLNALIREHFSPAWSGIVAVACFLSICFVLSAAVALFFERPLKALAERLWPRRSKDVSGAPAGSPQENQA